MNTVTTPSTPDVHRSTIPLARIQTTNKSLHEIIPKATQLRRLYRCPNKVSESA